MVPGFWKSYTRQETQGGGQYPKQVALERVLGKFENEYQGTFTALLMTSHYIRQSPKFQS